MKALITGASSGIGKEIARYLAELGYDLILVSRSTDKLNKLKEKLSNVNVRVITLDFHEKVTAWICMSILRMKMNRLIFLSTTPDSVHTENFWMFRLKESLNSFTPMFQRFTF